MVFFRRDDEEEELEAPEDEDAALADDVLDEVEVSTRGAARLGQHVPHAVGCASGTDALLLPLRTLDSHLIHDYSFRNRALFAF